MSKYISLHAILGFGYSRIRLTIVDIGFGLEWDLMSLGLAIGASARGNPQFYIECAFLTLSLVLLSPKEEK